MTALVIAEHDNQDLHQATRHTVTAAAALSDQVMLLIAGHNCGAVVEQAQHIEGINQLWVADAAAYTHFLAENLAELIAKHSVNMSHILAPATTFGKNVMPRVAALLDVAQISDITEIVDVHTFVRSIYAGSALQTVRSKDAQKVITVRSTAFTMAQDNKDLQITVEQMPDIIDNRSARFVGRTLVENDRPELTTARVVIAGGRGVGSAENFQLLYAIADRLHAAVGASRAAVDAGFLPNDCQIGQTGKVVSPELYIAVGISGAAQHLAGMIDSRVIVAIDKDEDAPIFEVADYSLVADLFEALPALEKEIM